MLEVKILNFDELTEIEKKYAPTNGAGKEDATYLKVFHDGEVISYQSDAMEPEDACFYRDLNWIYELLQKCYDLGRQDGE